MNKSANQWSVLIVAAVASFLTPFMGSSINIALPSIAANLHIDAVSLTWVTTGYTLAAAAFLVPFGRIADIVGRKRIFMLGAAVYAVSTVLSAMATSGTMLIACRTIEGAGSAMIFGTSTAILTSVFPKERRGQALGINVASVYVGLSVGPTLGGILTQQLGWRSVFLATMPLALLIVVLASWGIHGEWAEARGEPFDAVGSVIYGLSLVSLMYGFSVLRETLGPWLVLLGVAGLVGFIAWENHSESPVLEVSLFRRNTVFAMSNLAAWLNYGATTTVGYLLSLYLQYIKGLQPQQAGLVLIAQPIIQAVFSPLAGRLSDRVEPRIVASAGMGLTVVGLVLLTTLSATTSMAYILVCLVLFGFGFALFSSPNTNAIMSSVDRKRYGLASGMVGTMRLTGNMFGMGIAMLVFALRIGRVEITPASYDAFLASARVLYAGSAVLCFGGVFASLARGRLHRAAAREY